MTSKKHNSKPKTVFSNVTSFRNSEEIEAIISYHVKTDKDDLGKPLYDSDGHYIRSAILFFDRMKKAE